MGYTVTLKAGLVNVLLPNGIRYGGGSVVVLSDAEFSVIGPSAQSALFSSFSQTTAVGAANGVATLDSSGLVPLSELPISAQSLYLAGTGVPSASLGLNGDYYLDQNTGNLYGPKASGAWGSSVPVLAQTLRDTYLRASTIIGETTPRSSMLNTGIGINTGQLQLSAVPLPKGAPVGHLQYPSASTAAVTPAHWWFALFDQNLNMLAVTADQLTAAWAASTYQSLAVATTAAGAATSFTTTYTGLYYIGIMMAAATTVSLVGGGHAAPTVIAQTPVLNGLSTGSLTAPPAFPFQAGAITPSSSVIYAAVAT